MENKIITYVKRLMTALDDLKEKIIAINSEIEKLPTSLESDFTEVKNAVDGVSTKVDGVRIDISEVKTDTEQIKINTESIETDFTDVKNLITDVKNSQDVLTSAKNARFIETSGAGVVVNITGKGKLYFAGFGVKGGANDRSVTITLDGHAYKLTDTSGWSSQSGIWFGYACFESAGFIGEYSGLKVFSNFFGAGTVNNIVSSTKTAVSVEPLVFKQSLKIEITNSGKNSFNALYELG